MLMELILVFWVLYIPGPIVVLTDVISSIGRLSPGVIIVESDIFRTS